MYIGNICKYDLSDIEEGDHVTLSMWGGGTRSGIVGETHEEIKNGRAGIDYENESGTFWAYLDQVADVQKAV